MNVTRIIQISAILVFAGISTALCQAPSFLPVDAPNTPVGLGKGIHPGRVVWAHDTAAVRWDGTSGTWWTDDNTDPAAVDSMLSRTVRGLTGKKSTLDAWHALFAHSNQSRGKGTTGYVRGQTIAMKLNLNVSQSAQWKNDQAPSPQLVRALLRQLTALGVPESCITVSDPSRIVGDPIFVYCRTKFPGVRFVDQFGKHGRIAARPDTSAPIFFADTSAPFKGKFYIASCLSRADYLINLAVMRGHSLAGVTLTAKNHYGSIWKNFAVDSTSIYFGKWGPSGPGDMKGLHGQVSVHAFDMPEIGWKFPARPMGSSSPLVDLMGHKELDSKCMLFIIDGLYAALHQSATGLMRWTSAPFGTPEKPDWPSSLFVSQDEVALESVALDMLRYEPGYATIVTGNVDNYLHEAAQAGNPPSKAIYDPENDGTRLASLGVHEHWNSQAGKKYSRNMGKKKGIELVYLK